MSEPVSNAEIEDVLSSIRRLVSNDVEAAQEETASEPAEAESVGKLILTADFRVPEPQDNPPEETAAEAGNDTVVDDTVVDDTANEDSVTEGAWQEDAAPEEAVTEEAVTEEAVTEEAVTEEAIDNAPLEFHHTEHKSEDEIETEVETETETGSAQEEINEVWQDPAEQIEETAPEMDAGDSPPSLEDTIADLEAAIGQQQGDWEPDGSDFEEDPDAEEVMSEPVQDWIDSTAQEVGAEAMAEVEEAKVVADVDDTDLFGDQESVIDEETLRDMVSDIVRQELQGALGERITRNVRKLVRREINRVLAAQDFE